IDGTVGCDFLALIDMDLLDAGSRKIIDRRSIGSPCAFQRKNLNVAGIERSQIGANRNSTSAGRGGEGVVVIVADHVQCVLVGAAVDRDRNPITDMPCNQVVAGSTEEFVGPRTGGKLIVIRAAIKRLLARAGKQRVVPSIAKQGVVATTPD